MNLVKGKIIPLIQEALSEDIGRQDLTTRLVISKEKKVKAVIIAKDKGIVCGINIAGLVFKSLDKNIRFMPCVSDGDRIRKGKILAKIYGRAHPILSAERVALNFLDMLSGIATVTGAYVDKVKPYKVKILDTRKTLPGLRNLEKYAVRAGGGFNHRFKLDEMVLIKDNHFKVIGDRLWVMDLREIRKKISPKIKIEVEVKTLNEFKKALKIKPDIIMLDNMNIKEIKKAVKTRKNRQPKLEISGNINLDNVRKYASLGADFISVGSLTKKIDSLDTSLEIL